MPDMRLIDANALMRDVMGLTIVSPEAMNYANAVAVAIANAPTIDAVEVVHAKWVWTPRGWCCSACCKPSLIEAVAFAKWCPRCGAKMDAKEDKSCE